MVPELKDEPPVAAENQLTVPEHPVAVRVPEVPAGTRMSSTVGVAGAEQELTVIVPLPLLVLSQPSVHEA